MAKRFDWEKVYKLMVVSTACLCMLIIVSGLFFGVLSGRLSDHVLQWGTGAALGTLVYGIVTMVRIVLSAPEADR